MRQGASRRRRVGVAFAAAAFVCWSAHPAMARPLTEDDIATLLASVSPKRVAALIEEKGIAFDVNAAVEAKLRAAGAGDEVDLRSAACGGRVSEQATDTTVTNLTNDALALAQFFLDRGDYDSAIGELGGGPREGARRCAVALRLGEGAQGHGCRGRDDWRRRLIGPARRRAWRSAPPGRRRLSGDGFDDERELGQSRNGRTISVEPHLPFGRLDVRCR